MCVFVCIMYAYIHTYAVKEALKHVLTAFSRDDDRVLSMYVCVPCMHSICMQFKKRTGALKHAYVRTYIHTYIHTNIHTCMHACIHTYSFKKVYIENKSDESIEEIFRSFTRMPTYIHTHTHTYSASKRYMYKTKSTKNREKSSSFSKLGGTFMCAGIH